MSTNVVTFKVNGTPLSSLGTGTLRQVGARGSQRVNNAGRASFIIDDRVTASVSAYRPQNGATVELSDTISGTIFKGIIISVTEGPIVDNIKTSTQVECIDFVGLMRRIVVNRIFNATATPNTPSSITLKAILTSLCAVEFAALGVTLAAMADGPTFTNPITFSYAKGDEVLKYLSEISGYLYWVNSGKILIFWAPGDIAAPYSITSTNGKSLGQVRREAPFQEVINKVFLFAGAEGSTKEMTDLFAGNSSTTVWTLLSAPGINFKSIVKVTVDGQDRSFSNDLTSGSAEFRWNPTLHRVEQQTAVYAIPVPTGSTLAITWVVEYPIVVESIGANHATNPIEEVYRAPEIYNWAEAVSFADALTDVLEDEQDTITVATREQLLLPGQAITLTFPERQIIGQHIILEVGFSIDPDNVPRYSLKCTNGEFARRNWVDFWKQLSGGASAAGSVGGGTLTGGIQSNRWRHAYVGERLVIGEGGVIEGNSTAEDPALTYIQGFDYIECGTQFFTDGPGFAGGACFACKGPSGPGIYQPYIDSFVLGITVGFPFGLVGMIGIDANRGAGLEGGTIQIPRNSYSGGAAGSLALQERSGTFRYLWFDDHDRLHAHSGPPQEGIISTPNDYAGVQYSPIVPSATSFAWYMIRGADLVTNNPRLYISIDYSGTPYCDIQVGDSLTYRTLRINPLGGSVAIGSAGTSIRVDGTAQFYDGSDEQFFILGAGTFHSRFCGVSHYANGTGAKGGALFMIGRNTSGNGAAGCLVLFERNGTARYFWVEAGVLRMGAGGPTEDNTTLSHSSGSPV